MRTIDLSKVSRLLEINGPALYICAPNFEYRSVVATTKSLAQIKENLGDRTFRDRIPECIILTLQASNVRVPPLEDLKRSFKDVVDLQASLLFERTPTYIQLPYPDQPHLTKNHIDTKIRGLLKKLVERRKIPVQLILDISALPRLILLYFCEAIRSWRDNHLISDVIILYTFAENYASNRYPAQVGEFQVLETQVPLTQWLNVDGSGTTARAVVFLGRQGFDAISLLDAVQQFEKIDLLGFLNRDSPSNSFEIYRANAPILERSKENHRLHYFLTVEQGHSLLGQILLSSDSRDFTSTVIAPFNAKPFLLSSFLLASTLRKVNPNNRVAIATLPAHHYGSVYSLGAGITEAYTFNLSDL